GYGPVTVDLLLTLPDDGYRYEVVEGALVRMVGSGFDATTLVLELGSCPHLMIGGEGQSMREHRPRGLMA
ncbi:MAG: hypothetical protein LC769_11575, partial [Chloroflexi bacterium]|nr:hypothetical protein [Chloroflexota bacterium]